MFSPIAFTRGYVYMQRFSSNWIHLPVFLSQFGELTVYCSIAQQSVARSNLYVLTTLNSNLNSDLISDTWGCTGPCFIRLICLKAECGYFTQGGWAWLLDGCHTFRAFTHSCTRRTKGVKAPECLGVKAPSKGSKQAQRSLLHLSTCLVVRQD